VDGYLALGIFSRSFVLGMGFKRQVEQQVYNIDSKDGDEFEYALNYLWSSYGIISISSNEEAG
jgi:HJR/Mrr/RecB family endonuclease